MPDVLCEFLILFGHGGVSPSLLDQFGFIPFFAGFGQAYTGPNSKGQQFLLSHEAVLHSPVLTSVRMEKQV